MIAGTKYPRPREPSYILARETHSIANYNAQCYEQIWTLEKIGGAASEKLGHGKCFDYSSILSQCQETDAEVFTPGRS